MKKRVDKRIKKKEKRERKKLRAINGLKNKIKNINKIERSYVSNISRFVVESMEEGNNEWGSFNAANFINGGVDNYISEDVINLICKNDLEGIQESKPFNETERKLIYYFCSGIVFDNIRDQIDEGMNKLLFQAIKIVADTGLENKKIDHVDIVGGYNDILVDFKVTYLDGNEKYNDFKNKEFISINYSSTDKLYNEVQRLKLIYKGFSINSLNRLANSMFLEYQYNKREEGNELCSYDIIVLGYITVLEFELKNLIKKKRGISNDKQMMLGRCISYLKDCDFDLLSNDDIINKLEVIRNIRNSSAHGNSITREDFDKVKTILINQQLLEFISFELIKL